MASEKTRPSSSFTTPCGRCSLREDAEAASKDRHWNGTLQPGLGRVLCVTTWQRSHLPMRLFASFGRSIVLHFEPLQPEQHTGVDQQRFDFHTSVASPGGAPAMARHRLKSSIDSSNGGAIRRGAKYNGRSESKRRRRRASQQDANAQGYGIRCMRFAGSTAMGLCFFT
jgi:hypothetical protein